jgi:hypothetical protein
MKAYGLLFEAADAVEKDDERVCEVPAQSRARSAVKRLRVGRRELGHGQFKNLNAQIGSYETYDDELFGVKTFFSFCLFQNRQQETTRCARR